MARRTYIPQLVNIMRRICKYIVRYRQQLDDNLPEGGSAILDQIVEACEALLELIPTDIPEE